MKKEKLLIFSIILVLSIVLEGCGLKSTSSLHNTEAIKTGDNLVQSNTISTNPNSSQQDKINTENNKRMETNPKDLFSYLDMTKEDIIKKLGNNYEMINHDDYSYKSVGLIFSINPNNSKVNMIECYNNAEVFGTKAGMNYDQVIKIYSELNLKDKLTEEVYDDGYGLIFINGEYTITYQFTSAEDKSNCMILITKNY